jgi:hypothetical protein
MAKEKKIAMAHSDADPGKPTDALYRGTEYPNCTRIRANRPDAGIAQYVRQLQKAGEEAALSSL